VKVELAVDEARDEAQDEINGSIVSAYARSNINTFAWDKLVRDLTC
jgi:hypothetical protein